jgi:DNA-binding response OmpR family regulator
LDVKERRPEILVVEDDATLAAMYKATLRFAGFNVFLASDVIAALWHIDQALPDLVVLDLNLPGLRGDAILEEISGRPDLRHIPVIVVTGSDTWPVVAQARAILRKPCDPSRLVSTIQEHLHPAA